MPRLNQTTWRELQAEYRKALGSGSLIDITEDAKRYGFTVPVWLESKFKDHADRILRTWSDLLRKGNVRAIDSGPGWWTESCVFVGEPHRFQGVVDCTLCACEGSELPVIVLEEGEFPSYERP